MFIDCSIFKTRTCFRHNGVAINFAIIFVKSVQQTNMQRHQIIHEITNVSVAMDVVFNYVQPHARDKRKLRHNVGLVG